MILPDNGISLELISHEELFKNLSFKPIIANDIAAEFATAKAVDIINDLIRTHYPDDKLDTVPKCQTGCTVGAYNLGRICKKCGTEVMRDIVRPLESKLWLKVPDGVPAFINPRFWRIITSMFSTAKLDIMQYLTDPNYIPGDGKKIPDNDITRKIMKYLEDHGIERNMKYFYHNFDYVMEVLLVPKPFLKNKKNGLQICMDYSEFVRRYRHCIFTRYIPFPSKLIFPSEQSGSMTFIDPTMILAFDSVKLLCNIVNSPVRLSKKAVYSKTSKVNSLMADYHHSFKYKTCGGKKGTFRKHHDSTRSAFTARNVITPLAMEHEYDEVHIPWMMGLTLLKLHIVNKMIRRKFTPKHSFRIIDAHVRNSSGAGGDLLEEILIELIVECPEKGIPAAILRNPTLERGSDQLFRITKIIRNCNVSAVMISVLAIKAPNADFDGDELQIKLLIDNIEKLMFSRLKSHLTIIDTDSPRAIKDIITLHPETITFVNNYLARNRLLKRS